jgi:hypothetical protein
MIHLVITEKLTPEGKKDFKKVLELQKRLDEWLMSHGAAWKSVKHLVTLIGEPTYETWLEYPNYSAIDQDEERSKEFPQNPEWRELITRANAYFQRVNSKVTRELQLS